MNSTVRGLARGLDNGRLAFAKLWLDVPRLQPVEGSPHYLPNPVRLTIGPTMRGEEVEESSVSLEAWQAVRLALALALALVVAAVRSIGHGRRIRKTRAAEVAASDARKARCRS